MKKKLLVFAAVFMLVLSVAGQAMASFAVGDLIEVVYQTNGLGNEVATDLGPLTSLTSAASVTDSGNLGNTINFTTLFPGQSVSNLNVAYFMYTASGAFWVSGPIPPSDGQTIEANGHVTAAKSAMNLVQNLYAGNLVSGSTTQAQIASSAGNSYWNLLDKNSVAVGSFGTLVNGGTANEANLANLATTGYVDQYLYYYPSSVSGIKNSAGVEIADIRTFADGSTEIIPLVTTPLPAAFWLLGSGLVGLVGIRRRKMAV
jgi:hypothetical protein